MGSRALRCLRNINIVISVHASHWIVIIFSWPPTGREGHLFLFRGSEGPAKDIYFYFVGVRAQRRTFIFISRCIIAIWPS